MSLPFAAPAAPVDFGRPELPAERRAAILALLLTPDCPRERHAWAEAVRTLETGWLIGEWVDQLPAGARLPVLAALLDESAPEPLPVRQALLLDARRIMCADGRVRPIDRLTWLVMRHRLGGRAWPRRGGLRDDVHLNHLPLALRQAIGHITAYLARLVPAPVQDAVVGVAGTAWYDTVMHDVWGDASALPGCHVPDVDTFGRAAHLLQSLGWMHRPILARLWVDAATTRPGLATRPGEPLPVAAQALWLACTLLDTPLPPALARHFVETPGQGQARDGT